MFDHAKAIAAGFFATLLLVIVGFTVVAPRIIGGASLTVLTGSMDPTIPAGSIVLVEPTEGEDVRNGDVITFQARPNSASLITHRVVGINYEDDRRTFTTKGDANEGEDTSPVPEEAVRGKVVFHLPYLGSIADRVRSPEGIISILVASAAIYGATELRKRRSAPHEIADAPVADMQVEPEVVVDVDLPAKPEEHVELAPVMGGPSTAAADICRELLVARVRADREARRELLVLANACGGELVATSGDQIVVQLAGQPETLNEFENHLETWPDRLVHRSGAVSFSWDSPREDRPRPARSLELELHPAPLVREDGTGGQRPLADPAAEFDRLIASIQRSSDGAHV